MRDFVSGDDPTGDIDVLVTDDGRFNPERFTLELVQRGIEFEEVPEGVIPKKAVTPEDGFVSVKSGIEYKNVVIKDDRFKRLLIGEVVVDFCYPPILNLDFTVHALTMSGLKPLSEYFQDSTTGINLSMLYGSVERGIDEFDCIRHIKEKLLIPCKAEAPQFRVDKMVAKGYSLSRDSVKW